MAVRLGADRRVCGPEILGALQILGGGERLVLGGATNSPGCVTPIAVLPSLGDELGAQGVVAEPLRLVRLAEYWRPRKRPCMGCPTGDEGS